MLGLHLCAHIFTFFMRIHSHFICAYIHTCRVNDGWWRNWTDVGRSCRSTCIPTYSRDDRLSVSPLLRRRRPLVSSCPSPRLGLCGLRQAYVFFFLVAAMVAGAMQTGGYPVSSSAEACQDTLPMDRVLGTVLASGMCILPSCHI